MLEAARAGDFEFVIAESLSRLARDQEDAPAIRKRLEFSGVKIVTTVDGLVSPLMHGLRTIIDSQFLDDLKSAVRRGMSGVIRDGRHAGGAIYGYRSIPGRAGELEIIPEEAEIVRRVFREYIDGCVPRSIAATLNAEGVPPPRKSFWRASTINGHTKRKTGILQNEIYCGRLIWNRAYRVRDPDSGKRVWRYKRKSSGSEMLPRTGGLLTTRLSKKLNVSELHAQDPICVLILPLRGFFQACYAVGFVAPECRRKMLTTDGHVSSAPGCKKPAPAIIDVAIT